MSFSQNSVGNCCGAWCVTRYLSLTKNTSWASSDASFKKEGETIWGDVKFKSGDGADPNWVTNEYSDPWKIVDALETRGVKARLWIEIAADRTTDPTLGGMVTTLKNLTSRGNKLIGRGNISGLIKGGYAIAIMGETGGGMHYLLVRRPGEVADLELYDPRSETLNWTTHKTFNFLSPVITKPIIGGSAKEQYFKFLGVYIAIETPYPFAKS